MLVQEPLQATIWHCLNHYAYEDATFLAERLFAEVGSEESLHLLATCYYRSGQIRSAHHVLAQRQPKNADNRFLWAKCCFLLDKLSEAEHILIGDKSVKTTSCDHVASVFNESSAFSLQLLSSILARTGRLDEACECDRRALKLNPFLWSSYEHLCHHDDTVDPDKVFDVGQLDNFNACHGINPILNAVNNSFNETTGANCNNPSNNNAEIMVPVLNSTPNIIEFMEDDEESEIVSANCVSHSVRTPTFSGQSSVRSMLSGVQTLNFTADSESCAPLQPSIINAPMTKRKLQNPQLNRGGASPNTRQMTQKFDELSFNTPTFGVLPRQSNAVGINGQANPKSSNLFGSKVALKLNFSSPSLAVLSPVSSALCSKDNSSNKPAVSGGTPNSSRPQRKPPLVISPRLKSNVESKEHPLKVSQVLTSQSNVVGSSPSAPAGQSIATRRSSRLFGSSQQTSAKENSNKNSNSHKSRLAKNTLSNSGRRGRGTSSDVVVPQNDSDDANLEKNEKNLEMDKEQMQNIKSSAKLMMPHIMITQPQLGAQAVVIQKQSVDGLMMLLRQLGKATKALAKYECSEVVKILENQLAKNHLKTPYALAMLGRAHFEAADYMEARKVFEELKEQYPCHLKGMEYFSTTLWHQQDEVGLAWLAHELNEVDRTSPQALCALGNCFSHLKEHDNAIKFLKRAIQVHPQCSYAFTLLGHEFLVLDEVEKALNCFRSAITHAPRLYNAWYGLGAAYYKQERYQQAYIYYSKALAINTANPVLMCHMAVVLHALKKSDTALKLLDGALKLSPKNTLCKFEKASILFATEEYNQALEQLEELKQLAPNEAPVYFLLGEVHGKLNNAQLALQYSARATDLDPKGAASSVRPKSSTSTSADPMGQTATQEEQQEEDTNMEHQEDNSMSFSFNPEGRGSTSQESLEVDVVELDISSAAENNSQDITPLMPEEESQPQRPSDESL